MIRIKFGKILTKKKNLTFTSTASTTAQIGCTTTPVPQRLLPSHRPAQLRSTRADVIRTGTVHRTIAEPTVYQHTIGTHSRTTPGADPPLYVPREQNLRRQRSQCATKADTRQYLQPADHELSGTAMSHHRRQAQSHRPRVGNRRTLDNLPSSICRHSARLFRSCVPRHFSLMLKFRSGNASGCSSKRRVLLFNIVEIVRCKNVRCEILSIYTIWHAGQ